MNKEGTFIIIIKITEGILTVVIITLCINFPSFFKPYNY